MRVGARIVEAVLGTVMIASGSIDQTPPRRVTVVRAARMLDVKTGSVITNASVVVTGARITAAGASVAALAGATVIDLGDVILMPGLIDSHTHLLQNYEGRVGSDD